MVSGELYRRSSHASTRAEDQRCLAFAGTGGIEESYLSSEEYHRTCRRLDCRQAGRELEELSRGDDDVVCVAAISKECHGPVALLPYIDLCTDPDDLSSDFESRAVGPRWYSVVQARPHQEIGEVDANRVDVEVDFAGPRIRQRNLALDEGLGPSVTFNEDSTGLIGGHGARSPGRLVWGSCKSIRRRWWMEALGSNLRDQGLAVSLKRGA
jgi:hypothetical protein